VPDRLLLASIHDVSPRFESEIDYLLDLLAHRVGSRIALLVVPNHWGKAPIVGASAFAARLRRWSERGMEIFLHGYFHRDDERHERASRRIRARLMTAGEGEFLGLSRDAAERRIAKGQALLEDIIGRSIAGFVAPAWLYSDETLAALRERGVPIAEDHFRVWSPITGATLARGPVITWASRTRLRLASSLIGAASLRHAPLDVLRIGVHPPDSRHPMLVRSIDRSLQTALKTRRAGRYSELLPVLAAAA
jgi:predicted deacetylase